MSEFDKVILNESKTLYKLYSSVLKARYKTEEAAIAGLSAEIRKALQKYDGLVVDAKTKAAIQGDIERLLTSMVTN